MIKIASFDFGQQHKQTSNSCEKLKKQIDNNDVILNDLDYFIHEEISEMKNRVMLKSEQLKLRIDESTQELINGLEEYEKLCKTNYNESSKKKLLIDELKKQNDAAKNSWKQWSS